MYWREWTSKCIDNAIRSNFKKVEKYYNFSDLKLLDYKVRILNTGTEATTRVLIESTDKTGKSWFTVGVSPNIIEATQELPNRQRITNFIKKKHLQI